MNNHPSLINNSRSETISRFTFWPTSKKTWRRRRSRRVQNPLKMLAPRDRETRIYKRKVLQVKYNRWQATAIARIKRIIPISAVSAVDLNLTSLTGSYLIYAGCLQPRQWYGRLDVHITYLSMLISSRAQPINRGQIDRLQVPIKLNYHQFVLG